MQLDHNPDASAGAAAARAGAVLASLGGNAHERPPARGPRPSKAPVLRPSYIEHKKKVPWSTFELKVDELNPLQRRALDKLPTVKGVPVIRAIDKRDDLGFAFRFPIAPTELAAQALPALLERWDEKYEVAKAKAGLVPKPEPKAQPLRPRSPRRAKADDEAEEGVDPGLGVKVDMSVVDAAIAAHDAEGYADAVRAGARQADQAGQGELADPVGSSLGDGVRAALREMADQVEAQTQTQQAGPPADSSDALEALPDEYVVSASSAAPRFAPTCAPSSQTVPGRPPAKARAGKRHAAQGADADDTARTGAAASSLRPGDREATPPGEAALAGAADQIMALPALRLATDSADEAARHWIDPATGTAWPALCRLHLDAADKGQVSTRIEPMPVQLLSETLAERAGAAQAAASAWLPDATARLNSALSEAMKAARIPVAERSAHLMRSVQQLPLWLDRLQALLLDMQRAHDLARRIDQQLLAMPEWALVVRNTLGKLSDWHRAYLDSTSFNEAVSLLGRFSAPLAALQLTRQIGLFADPAAVNLQRQLAHVVEHARRWSAPANARGDCARVLAAWVDAVHQHLPEHSPDPEKTAETRIFPA
jgi:hypothetical protein